MGQNLGIKEVMNMKCEKYGYLGDISNQIEVGMPTQFIVHAISRCSSTSIQRSNYHHEGRHGEGTCEVAT